MSPIDYVITQHYQLNRDCKEIDELVKYLIDNEGSESIVLFGFSTGAQDVVTYLKGDAISDREYMATLADTEQYQELASKLIKEGKGDELMPRACDEAPITAYRYASISGNDTEDDIFSSDFTDAQLASNLGHINVPCLQIVSGSDSYVPDNIDVHAHAHRMKKYINAEVEILYLDSADHYIKGETECKKLVTAVTLFLKKYT
eukprot:CAMPEP_0168509332 /NCGR_PEP_ID=MMETSP0405-20121227/706_1 /TAXON_ID=498012 /ORGANISM="Trichosphaerium sp, Strain Am-I-7 wt" /LENGTH=202 /DNA_ID=CAMNT_0008526757 /DNA_START=78 /DNA_END=686 /DNA_ORIENTATION=-